MYIYSDRTRQNGKPTSKPATTLCKSSLYRIRQKQLFYFVLTGNQNKEVHVTVKILCVTPHVTLSNDDKTRHNKTGISFRTWALTKTPRYLRVGVKSPLHQRSSSSPTTGSESYTTTWRKRRCRIRRTLFISGTCCYAAIILDLTLYDVDFRKGQNETPLN